MSLALDEWRDRVGAADRVPTGWKAAQDRDPTPQVLTRVGLEYLGEFDFPDRQTWTIPELTGFAYSTSFLGREVLGGHVQEFERDLAGRLSECEPGGRFVATTGFAYELGRRPS